MPLSVFTPIIINNLFTWVCFRFIDVEQFAAGLNTNTRLPGSLVVQQLTTASGRGK
jgi:hypothetical protein